MQKQVPMEHESAEVDTYGHAQAWRDVLAAANATHGVNGNNGVSDLQWIIALVTREQGFAPPPSPAVEALQKIATDAPTEDPGEGDWDSLEDAFSAGSAARHFELAEIARKALQASGITR